MTYILTTPTVDEHNSLALADQINKAVREGRSIKVNGFDPKSFFNAPAARSYQNGTLSIRVKGKAVGKMNDLFFKVGRDLTIVEEQPMTAADWLAIDIRNAQDEDARSYE